MKKMYPFGYVILFLLPSVIFADRIDQYYQLRAGMEQYLELVKKNIGDQASSTLHLDGYDNAQGMVKVTSDVATSCISSSMMISSNPTPIVKVNAIVQLLIATYALINYCCEFIHVKKEQKAWLLSLSYADIIKNFPHIILIQYQIKLFKLLLEMNRDGNSAEVSFARIHLVTMLLPGPYENVTKKLIKKIYKKYFDANGTLLNVEIIEEFKIFKNLDKKIPSTWQDLAIKVDKFSPKFYLLHDSAYKEVVLKNPYNQQVLEFIESCRRQDTEKMNELLLQNTDTIFLSIYNFYTNQN